jgi:hypothetical protein
MPVVSLAEDGRSARGTWRDVILAGQLRQSAFWGEGPFENEYVKEDGVWKISRLHWYQTLYVPYEGGGWARHEDVNGARFVGARLTPDAPTSVAYKSWPGAYTPDSFRRPAATLGCHRVHGRLSRVAGATARRVAASTRSKATDGP